VMTFNTMSLAGICGEARVSRVQFVGQFSSAHSWRAAIAFDGGSAANYDITPSAAPERFSFRPADAGRVTDIDLTIKQTGTDVGAGFSFDGIALEVQPRSRTRRLNASQRI